MQPTEPQATSSKITGVSQQQAAKAFAGLTGLALSASTPLTDYFKCIGGQYNVSNFNIGLWRRPRPLRKDTDDEWDYLAYLAQNCSDQKLPDPQPSMIERNWPYYGEPMYDKNNQKVKPWIRNVNERNNYREVGCRHSIVLNTSTS